MDFRDFLPLLKSQAIVTVFRSHITSKPKQSRHTPNKMQQTHLGASRIRRTAKALTRMGKPGQFCLSQMHRCYSGHSSTLLPRFRTPRVSELSPGQMEADTSLLLTAPQAKKGHSWPSAKSYFPEDPSTETAK